MGPKHSFRFTILARSIAALLATHATHAATRGLVNSNQLKPTTNTPFRPHLLTPNIPSNKPSE
jgi:hypothetical protein